MGVFKKDFMWGGSVSSMQTEGAWNEGGKGLTTYDAQGITKYGSDWKTAIDFYHRYKEDIALFAGMGFSAYRFSLSWARILPDGEGEVNEEGLLFYEKVIDELLKYKIEPVVCLHHFDLPLALFNKYGGWNGRQTLEGYKKYVETVIKRFGTKVKYYIPFNEQNAASLVALFQLPPNTPEKEKRLVQAASIHHMFLASASVYHLARQYAPHAKVGGMVNFMPIYPATCRPEDILAAQKACRSYNYQTLDVFANGEYPSDLLNEWESEGITPQFLEGDLDYLKAAKMDFLAHSYYMSLTIKAEEDSNGTSVLMRAFQNPPKNEYLEQTEWGWTIDPIGLRLTVKEIYERYHLPVFTIECGIGVDEKLNENNTVEDDYRINYFKEHINQLKLAVTEDGVDLMGFLTWGPIDILSSQGEMKKRYGFIYVNRTDTDLKDMARYKKKSYDWFKKVITSNGGVL
ncbi:glycoside hydrolase family 1 protein [Anaerocolumna sp. AGMB13025]|uniref:glycoside hydrolase family 1 protein n=1 Tax=Anaerocolumna sp. AGMB13025 TaxID=3039116 RepID=UPI00241D0EFA|nr:glycoside hydrolase family 1 protein [Anaerocolumna sp. AGMB13025]WFR55826.1 glycoside hydrolase family 1 protein [Anaerocolumna sp. AGMB13025]